MGYRKKYRTLLAVMHLLNRSVEALIARFDRVVKERDEWERRALDAERCLTLLLDEIDKEKVSG